MDDKRSEALELLNDIKHLDETLAVYKREEGKNNAKDYLQMLQENEKALIARKKEALRVIKQMKPKNQRLIMLRYFERKTKEEIGEIVGYTYKAVWGKIHEAEAEFMDLFENIT